MASRNLESFKREVYELVGDEYEVIGEFNGTRKKIKMFHHGEICGGQEIFLSPEQFLSGGARCKYCSPHRKVKNTKIYKDEVYEQVGDEYTVLGEYKTNKDKILIRHNNKECDNHEFEMRADCFVGKQQYRCPKCALIKKSENLRITEKEFQKRLLNTHKGEYSSLEPYITGQTKITFIHNDIECGRKFKTTPSIILRGSGCPFCRKTKGEKQIEEWLEKEKFIFSYQVSFSQCRNENPLPFDFAVFHDDGYLSALIEYDGEMHYEAVDYFGGEEKLKETQRRDKIKTEFCDKNNISLIRIPYWEFDNIETILKEKLK